MIFITKVERKGKKVQLTFSDSTTLKISSDIFKKYNFISGEELNEDSIERLRKENEFFEAKISALRFLSIRNHSRNELRQKLLRKKFSEEIIEKVLNELSQLSYLNDKKFAEQFFNELIGKHFGPLKIKNEMMKRGIDKQIMDEILRDYFNDENFQKEVILNYLQKNKFPKKIKSINDLQKIYNHLSGRGFGSSAILKALREKFEEIEELE